MKFAIAAVLSLSTCWGTAQSLPEAPRPQPDPAEPSVKGTQTVLETIPREPRLNHWEFRIEESLAITSIAADAATTRLIINSGGVEYNPVMRPFVHSNAAVSGWLALDAAGLIYLNHRLRNHPGWRHALNWSTVGIETGAAKVDLP